MTNLDLIGAQTVGKNVLSKSDSDVWLYRCPMCRTLFIGPDPWGWCPNGCNCRTFEVGDLNVKNYRSRKKKVRGGYPPIDKETGGSCAGGETVAPYVRFRRGEPPVSKK